MVEPEIGAGWSLALRAAEHASVWHAEEKHKDEAPFINHLIEVAALVTTATAGRDPLLATAAFLHDAVEKANIEPGQIRNSFRRSGVRPGARSYRSAWIDEEGTEPKTGRERSAEKPKGQNAEAGRQDKQFARVGTRGRQQRRCGRLCGRGRGCRQGTQRHRPVARRAVPSGSFHVAPAYRGGHRTARVQVKLSRNERNYPTFFCDRLG